MTHRRLSEVMTCWRIGDGAGDYPVFSDEGARRVAGRWNRAGDGVIYASMAQSTAILEKLVRLGEMPKHQHYVEITVPAGTSYEVVTEASLPGWYAQNCAVARGFGQKWYREGRSAVLIVPSVIAREDKNLIINTAHADSAAIRTGLERPLPWDARLFH